MSDMEEVEMLGGLIGQRQMVTGFRVCVEGCVITKARGSHPLVVGTHFTTFV